MVKTHYNIIPLDIVQWFKNDLEHRIAENQHQIRKVSDDVDLESIYQISNDDRTMEHRVVLETQDPAYQKLSEYIYKIIPDNLWFYAAYQRQFLPHALHADYISLDSDLTHSYSFIIPLDENINNIFQTIVWNQHLYEDKDIRDLMTKFGSNPEQYPKIYPNSHNYDLQHVSWYAHNIIDSIELAGVYVYELGSIGQIPRYFMHCSSNWKSYKLCNYKDIIIVHVG